MHPRFHPHLTPILHPHTRNHTPNTPSGSAGSLGPTYWLNALQTSLDSWRCTIPTPRTHFRVQKVLSSWLLVLLDNRKPWELTCRAPQGLSAEGTIVLLCPSTKGCPRPPGQWPVWAVAVVQSTIVVPLTRDCHAILSVMRACYSPLTPIERVAVTRLLRHWAHTKNTVYLTTLHSVTDTRGHDMDLMAAPTYVPALLPHPRTSCNFPTVYWPPLLSWAESVLSIP
jgi:hypothetical protein